MKESETHQKIHLGRWNSSLSDTISSDPNNLVDRIWKKDSSVWKNDPANASIIANRLGWLTVVEKIYAEKENLVRFSEQIAEEALRHAVLLGMGGSSLSAEVLSSVFSSRMSYPKFLILDSTDPLAVRSVEKAIDIRRTLFLVSSKSGKTIETISHFSYFFSKLEKAGIINPGSRFIIVTDPGSELERLGREREVRRIFLNPPDIGGRYSALSYFGLVPAALMGADMIQLLESGRSMAIQCRERTPQENPGLLLGLALGRLALAGADKLTFVMSRTTAPIARWVEQLVAESTGKEGKGILPVEGERVGPPTVYGQDRVFVAIRAVRDSKILFDRKITALKSAGFPVITITLGDRYAIGGEFMRWEFAVAVAGAVMNINPFDEPNVQESKSNTETILNEFDGTAGTRIPPCSAEDDDFRLTLGESTTSLVHAQLEKHGGAKDRIIDTLAGFFSLAKQSDYVALLTFGLRSKDSVFRLDTVRNHLRDALLVPVLAGFGPRYLHSIGQLFKGGPPLGLFILITTTDQTDISVPGRSFTFGKLKEAQALGDFQALDARNLRVIQLHLKGNLIRKLELFETRSREAIRLLARWQRR